jgi:hypothetical protein
MDNTYSFYPGQNYHHQYIPTGVAIQDTFSDESKQHGGTPNMSRSVCSPPQLVILPPTDHNAAHVHHNTNTDTFPSEKDVFDPSAIFSTPYDAFRFDSLITTNTDLQDISITEAPSPLSPTGGNDSVHSMRGGSVAGFERRSSSEEKDSNPNPTNVTRRKAQNRAA